MVDNLECKYLSDYMALKFAPETTGNYTVSFYDRNTSKPIASSPYKVMVHEDLREIMRSAGVYDLTRLTIAATNLPKDYELAHIGVVVKDPHEQTIQNCFFANKKHDLVIEFITRKEGVHKIFLYVKGELVDDTPFFIYVNGDLFTTHHHHHSNSSTHSSISNSATTATAATAATAANNGPFASWLHLRQSSTQFLPGAPGSGNFAHSAIQSSSSNEFGATLSARSFESNSADSLVQHPHQSPSTTSSGICMAGFAHSTILCARKDAQFHFVVSDKNIQGLCVYGLSSS